MNTRQILIVARFELQDALRSRLVLAVVMLFGAGAGLGCYFFFQTLAAIESQVRETLIAGGATAEQLGEDLVRTRALPRLINGVVDDEQLASRLVQVAPLALFYAWGAFLFSAPLALLLSAGSHARDRSCGAVRYILTRTDRCSWAVGKLVGHGLLLALGMGLSACITAGVALRYSTLDASSGVWLAAAAVRAWVYAGTYLCLFAGVSLLASSASRARAQCILLIFFLWLGRAIVQSDWGAQALPGSPLLVWLYPAQYRYMLWSPDLGRAASAALALFALGAAGFALGLSLFRRRDA